jgi:tetratricopeptide (TPR) repeat protein
MPAKRKGNNAPASTPFRRSTRGWPLRKSQQINDALDHANSVNTIEGWTKADRLLTALGDLSPPLLLPAELALQVVALKIDSFRPEILMIIGAYAGSHLDSVSAGLERFTMARVICLIGQGRWEDSLTLAEPLWSHFAEDHWEDLREHCANLAFAQLVTLQYERAISLYDRFLENDSPSGLIYVPPNEWTTFTRMGEWHTSRGVSLMFLGRIDEAKTALEAARTLNYKTTWSTFADIMLSAPSRAECLRRFEEELNWEPGDEESFVYFLCSRIVADANFPNKFDAKWLREMNKAVHDRDVERYISYPIFAADDISPLVQWEDESDSSSAVASKRLKK